MKQLIIPFISNAALALTLGGGAMFAKNASVELAIFVHPSFNGGEMATPARESGGESSH